MTKCENIQNNEIIEDIEIIEDSEEDIITETVITTPTIYEEEIEELINDSIEEIEENINFETIKSMKTDKVEEYFNSLLEEKKIITNDYVDKFDEFIEDYSSTDEEEEPYYRKVIIDKYGNKDFEYYETKTNKLVNYEIHNMDFFNWKSYATFDND